MYEAVEPAAGVDPLVDVAAGAGDDAAGADLGVLEDSTDEMLGGAREADLMAIRKIVKSMNILYGIFIIIKILFWSDNLINATIYFVAFMIKGFNRMLTELAMKHYHIYLYHQNTPLYDLKKGLIAFLPSPSPFPLPAFWSVVLRTNGLQNRFATQICPYPPPQVGHHITISHSLGKLPGDEFTRTHLEPSHFFQRSYAFP